MFAGGAPRAKLEMLNVTFQIDFGSVDLSIFDDRRRTFDWKGGGEKIDSQFIGIAEAAAVRLQIILLTNGRRERETSATLRGC